MSSTYGCKNDSCQRSRPEVAPLLQKFGTMSETWQTLWSGSSLVQPHRRSPNIFHGAGLHSWSMVPYWQTFGHSTVPAHPYTTPAHTRTGLGVTENGRVLWAKGLWISRSPQNICRGLSGGPNFSPRKKVS